MDLRLYRDYNYIMIYTQVKPFNQAQGGTTPNLCLANVTKGYGIPNKYSSAWEAWAHTHQHTDPIPLAVDVPLYYSYTATIDNITQNYGHINVRLANGTVWSDGNIYASIEAYTANHWPKYVGWGDSVNDVTVVKQLEGDDMIPDKGSAQIVYEATTHSVPSDAAATSIVGTNYRDTLAKIQVDPIWKQQDGILNTYVPQAMAQLDISDPSQIVDAIKKLQTTQGNPTQLNPGIYKVG